MRLIVGFPPGSSADISARLLGGHMSQTLGQQVVIENRPGAGSSLAAEFVARAPKDGYTLFLGSSANITNQAILTSVSFDMAKDFAPIARATTAAVILAVHPSTNVKTLQELIALAKSKPGEVLYASTGVGTAPHLSGELFGQRAGVKLVHVPYQGSPQAATDLLAGRVHMMFSPASAVMSHVESGKLRALASAAAKRPAIAADVPTMEEAGIADFDTSIWFGLMAPAGTPRAVVDRLARALNEAREVRRGRRQAARARFRAARRNPGGARPLCRHRDREVGRRRPGGRIEEVSVLRWRSCAQWSAASSSRR